MPRLDPDLGGELQGARGAVQDPASFGGEPADVREALQQARALAERLAALQAVTAALSRARSPRDVAEVFVERATSVLDADVAVAFVVDRGGTTASIAAQRGLSPEQVARYRSVSLTERLPSMGAIRTGQAAWIESLDELVAAYPELARYPAPGGAGSAVAVPLRAGGRILGAVSLYFHRTQRVEPELRGLITSVADQCGQALERAELLEAEREARAAAERDRAVLDGIFENAPLGIGLFDRDLRFVRVNRVLAAWNGASAEAHAGRLAREVLPQLAWEEIEPALRQVLETGVPRVDAPVELPVAHGKVRRFLEAWYPVRAGGETAGVGAIIREVTAEREAEEFQRLVVGIVGHDLRTPLTTISTAAQLLRRGDLTEREAVLVDRIVSGARRLERIVGILLDYTQARAGAGIPVRRLPCDAAALCRSVADECEGAHAGRKVRCSHSGDATGEWDPDRLGQAVANLVTNALDYSPPDSTVEVRCRGGPDAVEVEVANAGPPIPPDKLPHLFEPFLRGSQERDPASKRGLGLGLFIARAIAAAHGGDLSVRSGADETAFTLRLPRS